MTEPPARILITEDDADTRANLIDILTLFGFEPFAVSSAEEALGHPELTRVDVILLDRKLPDMMADELLPVLKRRAPQADVIIATAYADLEGTLIALRHGAADYLLKPINLDALRASIERSLERHRLERDKARSQQVFRELVESAGSLILIVRPDHQLAYVNPVGERLAGRSIDEIAGRDCFDQFMSHDPDARHRYAAVFEQVVAGEPVSDFEVSVICSQGHRRWLLCNARRLDDYEGSTAVLVVGQDLTARRDAEQRLVQSERLAAIGKAMTGLAHESRNALQRSQAALDLLASELGDNDFAMKLITRIQTAQDDLHRLYEDVREYARPIRVTSQPAPIDELLQTAWDELIVKRDGREAIITVVTQTTNTVCEVEPFLIRQVFRNLIDNSLSACSDPVEITVSFSDTLIGNTRALQVQLSDNGPGVSEHLRQQIFDEFFTTRTHGTGLGLAIVKRLIEAHNGRITVDPHTIGGLSLIIEIPRQRLHSSDDTV